MTTEYMMTLKKALCRPVQCATGTWSSTDVQGTFLMQDEIPQMLLNQTIFSRKLDGFQGIRGSITLRLQATANPFQQGLLKLQFYPMSSIDPTFSNRALDPASWSYWPSVELNLGKETACEMRIPFTLPHSFCDLVTTSSALRPQMGGVFITVYSPLKYGSGSSTVGWNLYAHWNEDDLELFNPTPNAYQSGAHHVVKKSGLPADKEKKSDSISASLEVGANIAQLASGVPVLADVAGPTAWALRVASRVASALGFSRPSIDSKPQPTTFTTLPFKGLVEGPDEAIPLSQTMEPTLKFEPALSGKVEDEMTIDAFVGKFGFAYSLNLDTTAAAGTNIFNLQLDVTQKTSSEISYPKPFQLLGLLYKFWRGNIRIRVKFVKTKMHTARLMFCFFPGISGASNQNLIQAEYIHREIVDIASVEELVYELPFTANMPYLCTQSADGLNYYGSFQIIVVNPLQAPSAVANNIDMIFELAMGEGSEWYCPSITLQVLPTVPNGTLLTGPTAPKAPGLRAPNVPGFENHAINQAQAGEAGIVKVSTLSDAQPTGHQTETAQLCVGEKLLSLRQLIKYPASLTTLQTYVTVPTDANGYSTNAFFYHPFQFGAKSPGGNGINTNDFLGSIGPYFRFNRGGMRVHGTFGKQITAGGPSDDGGFIVANAYPPQALNLGMYGQDAYGTSLFGGQQIHKRTGAWSFLLPSWQQIPMVPNEYSLLTHAPYTTPLYRRMAFKFRLMDAGPSTSYIVRLCRQPADDYELIGFVGPPKFT